MAWEFSHTAEAYDNLRSNLQTLPLDELRELFAQWVGFEAGIAIAAMSDPELDIVSDPCFNPGNFKCDNLYNWVMDDYNDSYTEKSVFMDHGYQFTYATIAGYTVTKYDNGADFNSTVDLTSVESLAEAIWYRVMGTYGRTCTNGGHYAYIDPYHYTEMSFDLVEGAELEY